MSNFKLSGVLHVKGERQVISDKFTKREFVLRVKDGNYEQFPSFQLTQDRCDLLDGWNEGQSVTAHFNIRGREWQGKYFTSLEAWKIEGNVVQDNLINVPTNVQVGENDGVIEPPSDDLPF